MAIQISSELLDGCVLGILLHDDYYGYSLTQKVQESISVSESTMYPVLRRLRKNDLLSTYDEPYQGRNRRYYKITSEGKRQFEMIKQDWQVFKGSIDKMLGDGVDHE